MVTTFEQIILDAEREGAARPSKARLNQRWRFSDPYAFDESKRTKKRRVARPTETGALLCAASGLEIRDASSENGANYFRRKKCREVIQFANEIRANPDHPALMRNDLFSDGLELLDQMCFVCQRIKPRTGDYFYRDSSRVCGSNPEGLRAICIDCDNARRAKNMRVLGRNA